MKKTLLALACAALLSPVQATEVELYGAVDVYVAVNNAQGDWKSALSSGGSGASHFGIRGTEDLGGGTQVFFNLDQAFLVDTGSVSFNSEGMSFSREANLGIRGSFGQLSFGRQYTPHFLTFAMFDPTELSLGSSDSPYFFPGPAAVTGSGGDLVRADNSVMYVLPTPFGLTNFFFVSLGESGQNNRFGNIYNYAAKYDVGSFSTMLSYLFRNYYMSDFGKKSFNNQYINFAASYDFGVTKPVVQFTKKFSNSKGMADGVFDSDNFWMAQIGTSTPLWGGKWMISGSYLRNQSRDKANAWSLGTKYAYPLSKRTRVYAGIELLFNGKNAGYAIEAGPDSSVHFNLDYNTLLAGYGTDYLGKNVQQIFVGVSHQF